MRVISFGAGEEILDLILYQAMILVLNETKRDAS